MKLFHRILLAPLLTVGLMLFLGGVSYWTTSSQRQAMQSLVDGRFVDATMAEELHAGVLAMQASAYRILTWGDINGEKFTNQETKTMLSNFDAVVGKFSRWTSHAGKQEAGVARQLVANIDKYKKSVLAALDMASADRNAGVVAMQTADDNFKVVSALTEKLVALERDIGNRDAEQANTLFYKMLGISIGTLLVAIILSAAIAVGVSRSVSRQLGGEPAFATELVGKIATGDLSIMIPLANGDTTSLLAAMKRMVERLTQIVGQIKQGTESISTAGKEIAAGNADLSQRTEEQASSLEETASSMEELTSTVKQNAENAKQANQLALGASAVA
ncbi:MAG: MCP four helix bundle domain-containing protein, partial [Burkholderiales bacterium]